MALFKINKGLATNLAKNMPYAKEGFAYFTKDDGKFYIDIDGDGTTTKAEINVNRIPLNAAKADIATMIQATAMATDDSKVYPILAFNITDSTKNLVEAKYSQIGIKNGTLVIPSVEDKDEILISNEGLGRGIVIDNKGTNNAIEILNGKGIKVAQDPTENLELTTKQYVDNQNVVLELDMAGSTYWTDQTSYDFTLSAKAQAAYSRLIEAIEKGYIPTVIIHNIDNTYIYKYSFTQNLILTALLVFTVEIPLSQDGNHMGRDFIAFQSNGSGSTLTIQRLNKPLEYIPGDGKVNQILSVSNNGQATWLDIPSIEDLGGATKDHTHDDRYVIKSGDTMSGDLTLNKKLIANNLIVLKNGQTYGTSTPANGTAGQLFFAQDTSDSDYLPLTGGTLSGNLTLNEKLLITNKMYGATKPSNPVEGQIFFQKNDGSLALPAGGTAGQYLVKNSSNDSDASWKSLPALKYLPLSGGTLTGNLTISHLDTNDATVRVTNSKGSIGLLSSTNRGLYDYTKSKWLIYTNGTKASTSYALYGAVWNDYAEFREGDTIDAGRCVVEVGDDTLITSTERMMPGANITSDTFGFAIGETEQAKTPIAVSGRVLAYPYESREEFKKNVGRPVCSGPNGTVSIMTDEEYRSKGYCAIGTISAVPDYEEWGTGKVKVNGRVWIKV